MKELQRVARENGFYLCPERVWNKMALTIDYRDSEIKRLKKARDNWKNKFRELKNEKNI